jgi:hypothetical protein
MKRGIRENRISEHEIRHELQIFAIQNKRTADKYNWKEHLEIINIEPLPRGTTTKEKCMQTKKEIKYVILLSYCSK